MPHPNPSVQSEETPKIIFVRQQFSAFGGAELILDRILSTLATRGVKIGLLARSWPEDRKNIEFIRCNPPKVTRSLRESIFARAACGMIAKLPNVFVQSHERIPCCDIFRAGDGLHAAYLEQRLRSEAFFGRTVTKLSLFHANTIALERRMFASERLKAVVVNSEMVAEDLARCFGYPRERIHLAPNGIDLQRFSLDARALLRTDSRKRLGIDLKRPTVLFVGSGFERKGLGRAIEAVAALGKEAELVVVGSDRRPGKFVSIAKRAGIAERFHMVGPVADPLPYYAAADALILPTLYDPFPSTVIEALACGLPVVTTKSCGARDVVRKLDPNLVQDVLDRHGLTTALGRAIDLASNPGTRTAARKLAEEFSLENMVETFLALYGRLIPGFGTHSQ